MCWHSGKGSTAAPVAAECAGVRALPQHSRCAALVSCSLRGFWLLHVGSAKLGPSVTAREQFGPSGLVPGVLWVDGHGGPGLRSAGDCLPQRLLGRATESVI